jgi:hypothetical protein
LFLASLLDKPKREFTMPKGIIGILLLCIVSVFIHSFQILSLGVLLNIFIFFVGLSIVCKYAGDPKQFYKYITLAVVINCGIWLAQKYWFNFLPFENNPLSGGLCGTTPRLFNYLAIVMPIVFSVSPLSLAIPLLSILGGQYAPIVTSGITVFGALKLHRDRVVAIGTMVIGCIFLYSHIFESFRVRSQDIFPKAITEAAKLPLIGHGLGAYYQQMGNDSFNIFLLLGYDLGILGVFILGYALWESRKLFKFDVISMSMISVLAVSMFDYVIEIPRLWFTLMFVIAVFLTQKTEEVC